VGLPRQSYRPRPAREPARVNGGWPFTVSAPRNRVAALSLTIAPDIAIAAETAMAARARTAPPR
jgi:hypothetical protein